MKSCFAIFLMAVLCTMGTASVFINDGRPGCTTQEEINTRIFRNNWDPTSYWKCVELNEAAVHEHCPDQTAYLDSLKDCVSWEDWRWEEPIAPLSYIKNA